MEETEVAEVYDDEIENKNDKKNNKKIYNIQTSLNLKKYEVNIYKLLL